MKATIYEYFKNKELTDVYAIRGLLKEIPHLAGIVFNANLKNIIHRIGSDLFLIKAIYFDKSPETNWYVTWHQDTTINVFDKIETDGFTGWSKKDGFYSVYPSEDFLKNVLTIRIYLDDTDETNGALRVIPGSHNKKFNDLEIQTISQNSLPFVSEVNAGGIQLMRPLLLHASSKATTQKHRRVIHLEFAFENLPDGLKFSEYQHLHSH